MNYANMIEERKLKQGFIIATLISTIVGTFTTGIGLFDRLNDKRKQHKRDHSQDDKISELERRVGEAERRSGGGNGRDGRGDGRDGRGDDGGLRDSLEYGGGMVRREYDAGFERMGRRFGEGDLLAQTQLQSQIITLQSTVIALLEEALITGRPPDLVRLRNASEFAREGSIRALRDQYQRLLTALPVKRPVGMVRRISSTPDMRGGSERGGGGKALEYYGGGSVVSSARGGRQKTLDYPGGEQKVLTFNRPGPLFCRFAEELQRTTRPLGREVEDGCPSCGTIVQLDDDGRPWTVVKEVVKERVTSGNEVVEYVEDRRYVLTSRFLFKCHRETTGVACWLCYRFREGDTLCKGVESLVKHLGEMHSVGEFEREGDLRDGTGLVR